MSDAPLHICTVVGARPQFVKAAVVGPVLASSGMRETIVHTGQHYDEKMSSVFFEELNISPPAVNLDVGSGPHGQQTGRIMERLEKWLLAEGMFDGILVYGDTNTTLAGALTAAKLTIPVIHVEAGLRSFNREMPEEINRILVDRMSDVLCCPTADAVKQLNSEGICDGVHHTGDVMRDAARMFAPAPGDVDVLRTVGRYDPGEYYLATVHRAENTDDPERLTSIIAAVGQLELPVVLPLHPRTRDRLEGRTLPPNVRIHEPVGYRQMLALIAAAQTVLTDSGGVQKEACWLKTPCVTLREETEWTGTMQGGWNRLAGADPDAIVSAVEAGPSSSHPPRLGVPPSGDSAAECIATVIGNEISSQ